jgi:hypothetical protein
MGIDKMNKKNEWAIYLNEIGNNCRIGRDLIDKAKYF